MPTKPAFPCRLMDPRGDFRKTRLSPRTFFTVHPSAILRLRGREEWRSDYEREYGRFVEDLRRVKDTTGLVK